MARTQNFTGYKMARAKKKKSVVLTEEAKALQADALESEIVSTLNGYKDEAVQARKGGLNPRDDQWEKNINWYWRREDFTRKADWQAKEVMPEVSGFVDRFAAALKEALVATPNGFYTVSHPAGETMGLDFAIKRATDVWLSQCGCNQLGDYVGFPAVFEEQAKLGALIACCATVTWKPDGKYGRVAIESFDPRTLWLDHTYRDLYRVRQIELDKHDLVKMAKEAGGDGSIWNVKAVEAVVSGIEHEARRQREELTGHGVETSSPRQPVVLDEYLATVVGRDGKVLAEDALMVVANGKHLIRGPTKNPFWHGGDWIVYAPLITTPLSVYGKAYVEDFGQLAQTFNQLTNLILDAVQTSAIRAFAVVPTMLQDPGQLNEGIAPNKMFRLVDGMTPDDFFKALELGTLPGECVQVWQALKSELMEAAARNEIGMGQLAPNSRTSATEIDRTQQSTSAVVRSIAQTIETRFLNLLLDRVWKTGFQHVQANDMAIQQAVGADLFPFLAGIRRRDLIKQPFTFQASGISTLVQKNQMFRQLIQLFQVMGQSDLLMQSFLAVASPEKTMRLLFELSDVDLSKLAMSEQERLMRQFMPAQMAQPMVGPPTGPGAGAAMRAAEQATQGLGIQRDRGGQGGARRGSTGGSQY